MFGKNHVKKQLKQHDGKSLDVFETFVSIQGEGPFAGTPAFFIRLAGCNLRCAFCDTVFDHTDALSHPITVDAVLALVAEARQDCKFGLIVITGGEPLLQNIEPLVTRLITELQYTVQIETAGTVWVDDEASDFALVSHVLNQKLFIVVSPKTPKIHPDVEAITSTYKYIIQGALSEDDGLPLYCPHQGTPKSFYHIEQRPILYRPTISARTRGDIYVQACDFPKDPDLTLHYLKECFRVATKFGYKVSVQMHKLVGAR